MNLKERMFFKKLEEKSKNNPELRMRAAADYIEEILAGAFKTSRGINADGLCYTLAVMTGMAIADVSKKMTVNYSGDGIGRMTLETKVGNFYTGEIIDKYLYNSPISAFNVIYFMYSKKHGSNCVRSIQNMIEENARNMGNPDYKVWDNKNPYTEIMEAVTSYREILKKLEPYKLYTEEIVAAFAFALGKIIVNVEDTFPAGKDCLQMSLSTVMFYSHIDV